MMMGCIPFIKVLLTVFQQNFNNNNEQSLKNFC